MQVLAAPSPPEVALSHVYQAGAEGRQLFLRIHEEEIGS